MSDLADIQIGQEAEATQAGLMRLQMWFMGATHQRLLDLGATFRGLLSKHANDEGKLDGMGYLLAQRELLEAWQAFFSAWTALFAAARWQAGSLAFGRLALEHRRAGKVAGERLSESRITNYELRRLEEQEGSEADFNAVFGPQLQDVMQAANDRLYGDGIRLSQRIWQLDQTSWNGIQQILAQGVAEGNSAWNLAKVLESHLGAGRDCPRWTSTRLYKRTKTQIAGGDRTGLYTDSACAGQGVAYNALRLARNEFQVIHHLATDAVFGKMPWIEKEEIHLSPSHPAIGCACEDVVTSGEDGTGVYPKGEIVLPIHVQCLCYKTAVLMDDATFVARLRGWLNGTQLWGAMDDYASWLGVPPMDVFGVSLAVGIANNLAVWLWGNEDDLDDVLGDTPTQLVLPGM